jgi:hypothetical protein
MGWWRCCSATLSFSINDQVHGFGSACVNPWRVARPRKVSSCCECWGSVLVLVLGLVPAVCYAQGERFHCRRFGALSSQDKGVGALSRHGGVLLGDSLLLGQAGFFRFAFDASTSLHLHCSRVLRSRLRTSRTLAGFLVFAVVLGVVSCFQHSCIVWPFLALLI